MHSIYLYFIQIYSAVVPYSCGSGSSARVHALTQDDTPRAWLNTRFSYGAEAPRRQNNYRESRRASSVRVLVLTPGPDLSPPSPTEPNGSGCVMSLSHAVRRARVWSACVRACVFATATRGHSNVIRAHVRISARVMLCGAS